MELNAPVSVKMLDDTPRPTLGTLLGDAATQWHAIFDATLARHTDIRASAATALLSLVPPHGIPQAQLAERAGLTKQAVQQSLDQLEANALIRRDIQAGDRRARSIHLTDHGLEFLVAHQEAARAAERELRDLLGPKRFTRLRKTLRRLAELGPHKSA